MLIRVRSTLESIAEFAPRLTADSSLAIFVVSGEDTERIQGYRQIMQSASKNFEVRYLAADTLKGCCLVLNQLISF